MHVLQDIANVLTAQAPKHTKNRDYSLLIGLANRAIGALLEIESLSEQEKRILYLLTATIHSYTHEMSTDKNEYAKKYKDNTCDYKIIRELIFKFPGHDYDFLRGVINHYYYDGLLVYRTTQQMITIDPVFGLYHGMAHAQAISHVTKRKLIEKYFSRLKQYADDPKFTFKNVGDLAVNTLMPFSVRKGMAELIMEKKLLEALGSKEQARYTNFYTQVLFNAKDEAHSYQLRKEYYKEKM